MKASTQSVVAGVGYCLFFYLISWLSFTIPYEYNFEYSVFIPMILGLLGIPAYFIVRDRFDEFVRCYRLSYWIALTICSIAAFSVFAIIENTNRFVGWESFDYSFAFLTISFSGLIPLLFDLLILACKAFWRWLGKRTAI